jgi:ferric-dicitrate binding protein FerR (iron transport regulator)
MKNDPRTEWIEAYIQGNASREVTARLETALREDPDFRALFLEYLNVDGALAAHAAYDPAKEDAVLREFPAPWRKKPWMALAAGLAVMGLAWWGVGSTRAAYATVCGSVGTPLQPGAAVRAAPLRFEKGAVEFLTAKGTRVVVEAPAEVRFESADCLRVFRGKVAAEVPPAARGFTVLTPEGGAVDLGTRFGVDVPPKGNAEIHVFEGEVITQAKGAPARHSLRTGEATTLKSGQSAARDLRSSAFIQPDEVAHLAAGLEAGQRARSEKKLEALRNDPALIAAFDFENDAPFPGVFRTAQGRWPGSRAPEFVNVGDHLKVDVGAERAFPQLTLAAWVRIDRLGDAFQSLYHTDGWSPGNPGQVHWMLTSATTMRLALRGNTLLPGAEEKGGFPDSKIPVLPERGRWVHLAAVYDSEARTARFYFNGQFDNETRQQVALPARLGPAQIGNWSGTDRKLSGRMDELLLLAKALGDDEIRELYEAGNPYR